MEDKHKIKASNNHKRSLIVLIYIWLDVYDWNISFLSLSLSFFFYFFVFFFLFFFFLFLSFFLFSIVNYFDDLNLRVLLLVNSINGEALIRRRYNFKQFNLPFLSACPSLSFCFVCSFVFLCYFIPFFIIVFLRWRLGERRI